MEKIIHSISRCFFALCACLVLTAPLYASDESVSPAEPAASTAAKGISTVAAKQEPEAVQTAKHKMEPQAKAVNVDFKALKKRLKSTDAIGFFTKLAIRNDIVDLMDKIEKYRKKSMLKAKLKEIRSSFDGLLLKIIALLDEDPNLSRDLYVGRESIWESLLEVKA